jgi:hypothetical protein
MGCIGEIDTSGVVKKGCERGLLKRLILFSWDPAPSAGHQTVRCGPVREIPTSSHSSGAVGCAVYQGPSNKFDPMRPHFRRFLVA